MPNSHDPRRSSASILLTALLLGAAATLMFYHKTPGLSALLFALLAVGAMLLHIWRRGGRLRLRTLWLIVPMLVFAALVAVHSDLLLTGINLAAGLALCALTLHYLPLDKTPDEDTFADYIGGALEASFSVVPNAFSESKTALGWLREAFHERGKLALALLRGALITLPILLVFMMLLGSADAVFAEALTGILRLVGFDALYTAAEMAAFAFGTAVIAAGALSYGLGRRGVFASPQTIDSALIDASALGDDGEIAAEVPPTAGAPAPLPLGFVAAGAASASTVWHWKQPNPLLQTPTLEKRKPGFRLSIVETGMILGAVNLLFGAFVAIQFAYFFGGQAMVSVAGLTYSAYARRGFFELVAVAALVLGLGLWLRGVTLIREGVEIRLFRALSAGIVALTLVMLLSASNRMLLYEEAYGYTHLRVYTHIFMLWLGVLLGAYLLALFMPARKIFSLGLLIACIGFTLTLNIVNVDGSIARQNIARHYAGAELDTYYLDTLSLDAYPAVLDLYRNTDPNGAQHQWAGRWLAARFFWLDAERQGTGGTIFSANLTRAQAWRDLSPLREELSVYYTYRWNGGW